MTPETAAILRFLHEIGLLVEIGTVEDSTFVPGIRLVPAGLQVDLEKLRHPGDLLHEAGHLATMLPEQRHSIVGDAGPDMGGEIAAQTWSYAAAAHLGLPPEIVFHEHGYQSSAANLIEVYRDGLAGVVLLQWMGLTYTTDSVEAKAGAPAWPAMRRWLREAVPGVIASVTLR